MSLERLAKELIPYFPWFPGEDDLLPTATGAPGIYSRYDSTLPVYDLHDPTVLVWTVFVEISLLLSLSLFEPPIL